MKMRKRYEEMDHLRGIAILIVMLCHSVIVYPINLWESYPFYLLHEFTRYMSMPVFFVVSGFCFSYKGGYRNYIGKKAMRVLAPHFVFGAVEILPKIIPNPFAHQQMNPKEAVESFLLYGGSDWFLTTLFMIFLIFPIIHLLFQKGRLGKAAAVSVVAVLFIMQDSLTNIFQIRMASINLVYYMTGYLIRYWYDNEKFVKKLKSPVTAAVGFGVMVSMLYIMEMTEEPRIVEVIGALGGTAFFYYLGLWAKGKFSYILGQFSKYSLQMYLLNGYALVAARTLMVSILGVTQPIIVILFNYAVILVSTYLISKYVLDRFKVLRIASGL